MSTDHVELQREKLTPLKEPNFRIELSMLTICFLLFNFARNYGLQYVLGRLVLHFWVNSLNLLFTGFKVANAKHVWFALKSHCFSTALIILSHISFARRIQLLFLSEIHLPSSFLRRSYRPWVQFMCRQCQWYIRQVQFYVVHVTVMFVRFSLYVGHATGMLVKFSLYIVSIRNRFVLLLFWRIKIWSGS